MQIQPKFNQLTKTALKKVSSPTSKKLLVAALEYRLAQPILINSKEETKSVNALLGMVEPYEHQVKNLIAFCRRLPVALIADEVGLGKTISAGLVLKELMMRGKVEKALVLCPKLLMTQWKAELKEKFGIVAAAGSTAGPLTENLAKISRGEATVLITTYDTAKDYPLASSYCNICC